MNSGSSNNISLNVHLNVPQASAVPTTTSVDGSHTPNTPEILNSIVNMQSGPFASYKSDNGDAGKKESEINLTSPVSSVHSPDGITRSFPSESPASTPSCSISVQHYRSQFIKEGLKMKVQQKLGHGGVSTRRISETGVDFTVASPIASPTTSGPPSVSPSPISVNDIKKEELTEEDELRRMRRRERNKVAATKCRNKKKHRTVLLVKESETLEIQNHNLKMEINKLEMEKKKLMEVLSVHESNCAKRLHQEMPQQEQQQKQQQQPSVQNNFPQVEGREFYLPTTETNAYNNQSLSSTNEDQDEKMTSPADKRAKYHELTPYNYDIRPELQLNDVPMTESSPPAFMRGTSCCFDNPNLSNASSFLDKRPLRQSFIDLDSRCIAL